MAFALNPPLTAKNGHTLKVIFVGRVSSPGPGKQSIESLDDQEAMHLEWLKAHTDLVYEITVVAGSGSGELLDRNEYLELIALVTTGDYDLVLTEDLGRIVRRIHAHLFAELCVDHKTRLISKNDNVDTVVDGWQDRTIFSAWHHERSNRDTSERIKRAHRNRFKNGGALRRLIPGIIKPPGAKTDADLYKDMVYWAPIYEEWVTRLENGQLFSDIADWLNANGVPTGCKRGKKPSKQKYDCQLVGQRTRNVLLKGFREHNVRMSERVNSTGHPKTVKAPAELRQERYCPHLAFIEPERYDRLIATLNKRNARFARSKVNGKDCRTNVSRKRTPFPGQCAYCGVCGRLYVFGGNGQTKHLGCKGANAHLCWNGITMNGPLAAAKIAAAIAKELEQLEDFDATFETLVNEEADRFNQSLDGSLQKINADLERTKYEADQMLQEMRSGNRSQLIRDELGRLETKLAELNRDQDEAESSRVNKVVVPPAAKLRQLYQESIRGLAVDSYEFGRQLRRLIPRIVVYPVRLFIGGRIVLRSKFRLRLAALMADPGAQAVLDKSLERLVQVDLFDLTQREEYREQVAELRPKFLVREVAKALNITTTAVLNASELQRQMDTLGLTDPYELVTEPPEDFTKLRRHKHPRYKFEPLDNAGTV